MMTASSHYDPRFGHGARDPVEDKMEQVRELLFGEFKRDNDARFALVEARMRELETGIHRKLDAIQQRLEILSTDIRADRNAAFDELSSSVVELAERIRRLSRA
jgi:hypothetical protein